MTTQSPSPLGHATQTPPRKPSTRTVAQRKVYGKKRNNAPRAVFDQKSPARAIERPQQLDKAVEAIQAKLAKVSITEKPISVQETSTLRLTENPEEQTASPETRDYDEPTSSPPPEHAHIPIKRPSLEAPDKKNYETMVEVRIAPKAAQPEITIVKDKTETILPKERAARKKTPTARRSSGFVHDTKANAYVRPILNEALSPLSSQSIQIFSTWASRSVTMFHVAKLAEGSYGEVYKLHLREEGSRPAVSKSKLAKLRAYGDGVFKVVPLRAQSGPGSKKFTSIDEIVSEVKMLKYLDPIPGFARFREIHVVQGRFPETFQSAWDHYKKTKNDCMNPNPANKKAYPDTQLWAIIEMDDAGCELEKFSWSSTFQIYDIFWGVAMALARAEEYALFEHRDLHLGNVCIRSTRPDGSMEPPTDMEIARQQSPSGFGISALETTIIDYSLSRADLRLADLPDDPEGIVENASSDLDKKQIFDAIGQDEDEILLRDTYRYMRATVYTGNPSETEKTPNIPGIWAEYAPRTNLVWLLFILKNLLKNRKPEAPQAPVVQPQRNALAPCSPNRAMERQSITGKTTKQKDQSVTGTVIKERQTKDLQARVAQLKQTLEGRLNSVLSLLDLQHGHEDMCCAADLVAYAMDSQWLAEQDFF
ncbi:uncharacterized protein N7503_008287 [Penicillium pulvis]|uniref:uncharacterized protein n=1 Tax=Penicillium pulvis TaxID=1562058 RepID=UPI00254859F2|nr:uncharacterized protein N7503_008287 [Penicillium pulvis]KAJ5792309.1 hypothetical protein N7503_008287 [Penicillium pulvis]